MQPIKWFLVFQISLGYKVLESQWLSNARCEGPPTSMYIFELSNIKASFPAINESWPIFYSNAVESYNFGDCGNSGIQTFTQCCFSTPIPESFQQYQSGAPYLLTHDGSLTSKEFPRSANGYSYCAIKPESTKTTSYYISNGVCIDQFYRCFDNNTFVIYTDKGCTGSIQQIPTHNDVSTVTLSDNQKLQVSKRNINQAETTYIWVSTIPEIYQIPVRNELPSLLTHLCKALYFICVFPNFVYAAVKYFRLRVRNWLFVSLLQLLRILVLFANIHYYYTLFPDNNTMYISGWIYYSLLGIETLATIAYTYNQIHSFLHKKPSLYQMIAIVVIVLVLHAGLYGGLYFLVCFPDGSVCYPWKSFVKTWIRYRSYWFILVFILNFLPVQIIAFIVVSNLSTNDTNVFKTVLKMFSLDRSFTALTIVQVIIIILYFMVNYVQLQTTLCGDDMTYLLFGHIRTTLVGFHEILNIWLTSRIRVLFQGAANSGRESQTSQLKTVKPDKFGIEKSHPSVTTGL